MHNFYQKVIACFSDRRFIRSMRIPLAFFFVFSFCFIAMASNGQNMRNTRISLDAEHLTLKQVFEQIEAKTGFTIAYNASVINTGKVPGLNFKDETVDVVLHRVLDGYQGVISQVDDTHILIKVSRQEPMHEKKQTANPGKIAGKILDEKGATLPGATIRVTETGAGTQSSVDGTYLLSLPPGTYTIEVSFISYQTKKVTGVTVTEGKLTPLDISLQPANNNLHEVVVTASYKKASVEGLLVRQKNASEISNGISAEQLARTPDKNIGESLKRISGVSTVDNKFVLVRGIGERYNAAMMDGTVLPSTEAQSRNFSFDMIPAGLVDNVVVSKTVTPDMNASFGGGLIQINTKDIPNANFMSFTVGASYNDQSTGKDFLSHKRGKYDYLGFDDGRRDLPTGLVHTNQNTSPNTQGEISEEDFQKKVTAQSKKFTNDNFTLYKYKTAPSQNYQFSIGRLFALDTINNNKFGFTGALSYRNTQNINIIDDISRGGWQIQRPDLNTGAAYAFNTTLGALLNMGLQLGNNRFSLRNTYTHVYDNTLTRIAGYDLDNGGSYIPIGVPNRVVEADDPTYTTLVQNKLSGQHQLGKVKIEWDAARTSVSREEKDAVVASSGPFWIDGDYQYVYGGSKFTEPLIQLTSRQHTANKEDHYSWNLAGTLPFTFAGIRNSVKAGYFGNRKKATFDWQIAALSFNGPDSLMYKPISEASNPENLSYDRYSYAIQPFFLDNYDGKSQTHAGYVMFDSRIFDKLRLVWGLRGEYYKYTEIKSGTNGKESAGSFSVKPDKRWQWLPSANLTYSPIQSLNIRGAFSSSVVRPELMDNNPFFRYSPYLDGLYGNKGLYSTRINSYDLKTEWFPGLGEIISVGGYYKRFDKPAELTYFYNGSDNYYLQSADWAKVYGLEFEVRKNFGFITSLDVLKDITAYGNLTLQKSTVQATYAVNNPDAGKPPLQVPVEQKRAMYGQSPYLYNLGLQYTGKHLGFNAVYNKSGYKTYVVSDDPSYIEYEKPREQLDLQISYRFLKNKIEIKFNAGNLTNNASTIYRNTASYEIIPGNNAGADKTKASRLKPGFTNKYEDGDQIRLQQKFGRTYSTSFIYNF